MTSCDECLKKGSVARPAQTYPCALCGQHRCTIHAAWVPAYFFQSPTDSVEAVLRVLKGEAEKG